jgi:predicted Zn-dependent peptidase
MMRRLSAMLLLVAGMASAQSLQQDLQKINDEFEALPQLYRYPPHAQAGIAIIRMHSRQAQESEVKAR